MLDSIYIGMSGLVGYSRGLNVIANNTANINTPGFKGASLQFGDMYSSGGLASGQFSAEGDQKGQGLVTYSTSLDFSQGELRQTGNDLDLAVDGQGLFILKDATGELHYSRDGEFKFDDDGFLVSKATNDKVMAFDDHGALVEVSLNGVRNSAAKATSTVTFRGNLYRTSDHTGSFSLTDVSVLDASGANHVLTVQFDEATSDKPDEQIWKVTVKDGAQEVGTGNLVFDLTGNVKDAAAAKLEIEYAPQDGAEKQSITLDFSSDVQSYVGTSSTSTIQAVSKDGYTHGDLTGVAFDDTGALKLSYSNGQSDTGVQLALARFDSPDNVRSVGNNYFEPIDQSTWQRGTAKSGAFGTLQSKVVEISNVDLSAEFSDLVIMQRGYQASSQVISSANEMIQELFSLKGR